MSRGYDTASSLRLISGGTCQLTILALSATLAAIEQPVFMGTDISMPFIQEKPIPEFE